MARLRRAPRPPLPRFAVAWFPAFEGIERIEAFRARHDPDFDLEKNLLYLIHYPYGCIEQTTSSAFPQLFLSSLADLSSDQKSRIDR